MSKIAKGTLTLIPTPLSDEHPLEPVALSLLLKAATECLEESIFVIEDLKPGRRRWLHFGLPREVVDKFVLYNEHTEKTVIEQLLNDLKSGKNVYLMSDGGLPAFCDPGVHLVHMCHKERIKVTATPFPNSVMLALSLSGLSHEEFYFAGFLPLEENSRKEKIKFLINESKITSIVMDTPYRLKRVLNEFDQEHTCKIFLALDLGMVSEELFYASPKEILGQLLEFKREFILIVPAKFKRNEEKGMTKRDKTWY